MSKSWLRRTLRALDLAFWVILAGFWLVVLVLAVAEDDGFRIFIAALWLVASSVWFVRTLRSRRKAQHEDAQQPTP